MSAQWAMKVASGAIPGHKGVHKFGYNPDVDKDSDPEDIWDVGGLYPFLAAPASLYASSSSGSDTFQLKVYGLDADWAEKSAEVTLTGQSQVVLPGGTWIRVNRAYNDNSDAAVGDIYIAEQATGGDLVGGVPQTASKIKAKVGAGNEQTLMAIYSVPAGKTLFVYDWDVTAMGLGSGWLTGNEALDAGLYIREFGKVFRIHERIGLINRGTTVWEHEYLIPDIVPEKSDIVVRVIETTADNAQVTGEFEAILMDSVEVHRD